MAEVIKTEDSIKDIVTKMSQMKDGGYNPGSARVMLDMIEKGGAIDPHDFAGGLGSIMLMDTWDIRGEKIWMLYKDVCKEDLTKTIGILRSCQLGFISPSKLMTAVMNRGNGIDVDELMKQVREELPKFKQ